mmetsp:Transcript_1818/g.2543  ORF Transcript_1818/g.2543 Transcript_1818/m.2543 type:complete len:666 (+) Transcript_1818:123-2120(+)
MTSDSVPISRRRNQTRQQQKPDSNNSNFSDKTGSQQNLMRQHQLRRIKHRQQEERKLKCTLFTFITFIMGATAYLLFNLVIMGGSGGIVDAFGGGSSSSASQYLYASMEPKDAYPVKELLHPNYMNNVTSTAPLEVDVVHPSFLYPPSSNSNNHNHDAASRHRVVEFYAPWCPHCQHLKKKYVKFARNLVKAGWERGEDIDVYAVSCTPHKAVCHDLDIYSFPTIRLYKGGTYNGTDLKQGKLHPLLVFQTLGIQNNKDDILMEEEEEQEKGEHNHFSKKISHLRQQAISNNNNYSKKKKNQNKATTSKKNVYNDAAVSFEFAMKHGIFTRATNDGSLDYNQTRIFHKWLDLLEKSLPPAWALHDTVDALLTHKYDIVQSEYNLTSVLRSVSSSSSQHHHNKKDNTENRTVEGNAKEDVDDDNYQWSTACSHGNDVSGYTCGLWQLFHIISIGVVEWGVWVTDDYQSISTMDAADLIRNYIDSFFACEECRTNFVKDYDNCSVARRCERLSFNHTKSRSDLIQLPLWLWETHNSINVRLMKERFQRQVEENTNQKATLTLQDEIDVQWPSRQDCPSCWNWDGTWNEEPVYQYLRIYYWPDDAISREYKNKLFPKISSSSKINTNSILFGNSLPSSSALLLPLGALCVFVVLWYFKSIQKKKHRLT